jgi:probable selenium-dependent hydroxylase accessory protein YqeC
MNIVDALNINICNKEIISIIGAGGKTSTMYRIAWELKKKKKRVLITSTTAIYCPPSYIYDYLFVSNDIEELSEKSNDVLESSITVIGSYSVNNKLKGINKNCINVLYDKFDYIIVEADGAKRKPIKAPASYEPVIPKLTTKVIGCIGLDCIGSYINDKYVHRADVFSKVVNQRLDSTINYDTIRHLINSKDGLFKECGNINTKIVLFNKAYTDDLLQEARIASEIILQENKSISKVIIGNVQNNNPILIVME